MANYTGGGGGGGAAVVPATFVVASDREDYPLTQAGLVQAIADLPAGGGSIYIGEGTLAITSVITLSKDVKIYGAGPGVTVLSVTGAVSMFQAGDIELTMSDFSVIGTNTVGQTFLTLTADALATKYTNISNVRIGTDISFTPDGVRTVFNAAGFARSWILTDLTFFTVAAGEFLANGAAGSMRMSNVVGGGLFSGASLPIDAVDTTIAASGNFSFGNQSKFANCRFTTSGTAAFGTETLVSDAFLICNVVTFGASSAASCTVIECTTTTLGASCEFSACDISGAVTTGNTCSWSSCIVTGALTFGNTCNATGGSASGAVVAGTSCNVSGMTMSSTLTAGASSTFSACTVVSTVSSATLCAYSGCTITGAFTATGNAVDIANCVFAGALTVLTTSNVSGGSCAGAVITGTSCNVSGMTMTSTLTLGASSTLSSCTITGNSTTGNTCNLSSCAFAGTLTVGNTCNWGGGAVGNFTTGTSCNISGLTVTGTLTAGASSTFSACTITSTAAPAASCSFSGCTIGGAVTVSGASTKFSNCGLVSFSSTSLNSHEIVNCSFSGGGNNITLASSSSCQIHGNVGAQVVESGSSDSNTLSSIAAGSTLIGASTVVTDAQKFVFTSPGTLTTTDNALFARIPVQVTQGVRLLSVEVETAPTGANLIIEFKIGTRSTGALAAAFATLTLTAGAFTASTTVAAITITSAQFLVVAITQVGSTIPGSNATIVARA